MSNSLGYLSEQVVQSVYCGIKDFSVGYSIPNEQIKMDHWSSMLRDETMIRLSVLMSSNISESRSEGKLPATFRDWIKLYTGKLLGWAGIHPHCNMVTLTRTDVYNVCPHTQIPKEYLWRADGWLMHQVFMLNGPDIKDLGPELSKAANEIVQAALNDDMQGNHYYPSIRMLQAVRHYRDILSARLP